MGDDLLDFEDDLLAMDDCPPEEFDDLLSWDLAETTPYPPSSDDMDAVDPNTLVKEMVRLRKKGHDPMNTNSVVEKFNRKASEEFDYWLEKYNRDQCYVSRVLACGAINAMRVNAHYMVVESGDGSFLVDGSVIGATPDGKKVKLLFSLPDHLQKKYANCRSIPRMGGYWFDMKSRKCTDGQIPFCIAPSH